MGVFTKQHALKGQKLLAQGNALGIKAISKSPCKGKSFTNCPWSFKAFALTGRQVCEHHNPGQRPGLRASALSGRVGQTFERGIWQQTHGSECDKRQSECGKRESECGKRGSECGKHESEKERKKTVEKG